MVLRLQPRAVKQEEEIQGIQTRKEQVELYLFVHDMILKLKYPKNCIKNPDINTFIKVAGYKVNIQKSVAFLYMNNEQTEKEYRKAIPFMMPPPKKKF
jgi:hypothetical protein